MKNTEKETEKLLNILNQIKDKSKLSKYINSSTHEKENLSLAEYIIKIGDDKGYEKVHIIKNANLYRTYGYEILSGKKIPSRKKLLQICVGNKFSLDQTNRCLTLAKLGPLYAKNPKDSIVIYALNNGLNLIDTNIILYDHGLDILE